MIKKAVINKLEFINLNILLSFILVLFASSTSLSASAQSLPNFVDIVKAEKSKVVHIQTTTKASTQPQADIPPQFLDLFPNAPQRDSSALGTGFFYSDDGFIVTNNHVIKGADTIEVLLSNGNSYPAKLIGSDERTDLALLKITTKEKFKAVKWGDSSKVLVGQWVIAIGNPLGLDQTVTAGIISAKDRDVLGGTAYGQFLQTDAAINFGNSGGPLLNDKGEVIGINTAIAGGQSLGFAIPSNLAQNIISQLQTKGSVTRGWLGVNIQDLDNELASSLGYPVSQRGILVVQVFENSPAAKGGLKEQDIIIKVNNTAVSKSTELQEAIANTPPNTNINVTLLRNKKQLVNKVYIVEFKDDFVKNETKPTTDETLLGLSLLNVNPSVKAKYNLSVDKGVLITEISNTSPLVKRLSAGDVIIKINSDEVNTLQDFKRRIEALSAKTPYVLVINRFGSQFIVPGR